MSTPPLIKSVSSQPTASVPVPLLRADYFFISSLLAMALVPLLLISMTAVYQAWRSRHRHHYRQCLEKLWMLPSAHKR